MKKLSKLKQVIAFSFAILIFAACSSQRNGAVANKVSKGAISGTWAVSDVRLEGFPSGYAVKNAFDLAPYQNFVGSTWTLYGGYGGSIALTNGITQEIYWSIINNGTNPTFQFKKISAGDKARDVREGYQLEVAEATKTSLILRSPFTLANGGTAYIVYSFVNAK